MRQSHVAGEKLFVDYAGTTLEVIDGTTGEVLNAQLFVAALGASSYTWAEATWTQGLGDWIGSHTRAFVFYPQMWGARGVITGPGRSMSAAAGRPLRHSLASLVASSMALTCRDRRVLAVGCCRAPS
jgi:hypothetical protein